MVQGVFKIINKETFNMNPLCLRDEGLGTHFPNNRAKYDCSSLCKGTCVYNIVHLLVLGSLLLGSEIFFMCNIFYIFLYFYIFSTAGTHDIQTAN